MTECREIDVMTFNLGQLAVSRACLGFMSTQIFSTHMLLSVGPPYVCVPNNIIEVNEIRNQARVTETYRFPKHCLFFLSFLRHS